MHARYSGLGPGWEASLLLSVRVIGTLASKGVEVGGGVLEGVAPFLYRKRKKKEIRVPFLFFGFCVSTLPCFLENLRLADTPSERAFCARVLFGFCFVLVY